jgi:uncharacterized protein with HEPN domain
MSRNRREKEYLADMVEAMQRIMDYTLELTYEEFLADRKTQDAVLRNLQVMGEAVKKLSAPVKQAHPHLPWKEMAGMRDKVVHDYFGINYDIVWSIAKRELPVLLPSLTAILPGSEKTI